MLRVNDLTKSYGSQVILDQVNFVIGSGERVGLVGRNGHGKTTLFRMILDEEHPDAGVITAPANYRIGHLSQHIRFSTDRVLTEACLALPKNDDHIDETYKAETILMGLGFAPEDLQRPPAELSGGYQVRLNLAKALISDPNLLLLDEPTNYLDIVSLRWLTQFLRSWRNELILITHDRSFMDSVTTHTMGIHRRKVRKIAGSTRKLYEQILQEEEVYEKTRQNDERKRKLTEQFIARFRAQATKASAVQSRIKALERHERVGKLEEIKNLEFTFRAAPFPAKRLATVDGLTFGYAPDQPPLISDLSFAVGRQDRIAIIGKNGKGKTTLLNLLARERSPQRGGVSVHPQVKCGYFGQTNIERLSPANTVVQEIMNTDPDTGQGTARSIAGVMMFEGDNALKKISVLSGGEKSRVLLGKLLVQPANLLLLDEPTNHLDMESIDSLIEAIDAFPGAVVIVTHSEMILKALATRLIVFDGGAVTVFEGTYQDFLERVGWQDEGGARKPQPARRQAAPAAVQPRALSAEARRQRTGIVNERSKALGGLKKRIEELEQTIVEQERRHKTDTEALVAASTAGDGEAIKRLSKTVTETAAAIEKLFAELDAATQEQNERAAAYDRQLSELEQPTA